jgi:benzoate transport
MEVLRLSSAPPETARPNRFQLVALFALTALNMQDGFDILAVSYAASAIQADWNIGPAQLGAVFSAAIFGMMLGAMLLSPLADRFGRRPMIVTGLALSGLGMVIATFAGNVPELLVGRIVTGFGVGGILSSLNTLVAEYAGERYRGRAIAVLQLGFPLGAFLSGFLVAWLLDIGSWRHVFAFGAFTSFAFIPVVLALPESMDFLARSRRPYALARINSIRARLGWPPLEALPSGSAAEPIGAFQAVGQLFAPGHALRTILLWLAFFLLLTTLYFLLSWVPKLLIDMGFTDAQGNRGGRLINLAGMGGIVVIGLLSAWVRPSFVTALYLAALSLLLVAISLAPPELTRLLPLIAAIGFVIHGAMIGLYATTPALYPSAIRATGTGWAIGISRLGAVLGPLAAGHLLEAGWTPAELFRAFALPALVGGAIVLLLWQQERRSLTR